MPSYIPASLAVAVVCEVISHTGTKGLDRWRHVMPAFPSHLHLIPIILGRSHSGRTKPEVSVQEGHALVAPTDKPVSVLNPTDLLSVSSMRGLYQIPRSSKEVTGNHRKNHPCTCKLIT